MIKNSSHNKDPSWVEFRQQIANILKTRTIQTPIFKHINRFPLIKCKQAMYVMDWQQSTITYSKGIKDMFGYSSKEFNMHTALNFIHPDDLKIVRRVI